MPIILRWFWEMNNDGANAPEKATDCLNSSDPLATQQANFIAAWIHIWQRCQADGVTNVTWLWNPAGVENGAAGFYPGSQYVDWIGEDNYGYITSSNPKGGFDGAVHNFYSTFSASTYGKPILIAETGGCPTVQGAYITSAATDLPTQYPQVQAFMYFDSVGPYTGCPAASTPAWILTTDGLAAFQAMGALPYFSPVP
jgi:beta-mannanase